MQPFQPRLTPTATPDSGASGAAAAGRPRRSAKRPAEKIAVFPGADAGRALPHSEEAERCLLGSLLLNGVAVNECIERFASKDGELRGGEFFYKYAHQLVYRAMVDMADKHEPIDLVTVTQKLGDRKQLEDAGGPDYITGLVNAVPTAANLEYFLSIVRQKHLLRRLIEVGTQIVTESYETTEEPEELMDHFEKAVFDLSQEKHARGVRGSSDVVMDAFHEIEEMIQRKGALVGLATGFPKLDRCTNGLKGGNVVVIAARPSMGKTSLAMNIVEHVAIHNPEKTVPVGVFSLEMSAVQLMMRMICSLAEVSTTRIQGGLIGMAEQARLADAADRINKAKIWIDDTAGLTIMDLRARARRMKMSHQIEMLVVDYLQLLRGSTSRKNDNRQQEIAEISGGLKALAKELNVPVIVLSQLNREVEKREGGRPRLSDLRESGSIEQDADIVGLLARVKDDKDDEVLPPVLDVALYVAKNRNGPQDTVELTFKRDITRFFPGATVDPADMQGAREETA
jgi:replicative DNA helicase